MFTETKTRKPRTIRPAHGVARLTLTINGTSYSVRPTAPDPSAASRAFRLRKADGECYDVAMTAHGPECSCPDWIFSRDGIDPNGCKHIRAAAACGLL